MPKYAKICLFPQICPKMRHFWLLCRVETWKSWNFLDSCFTLQKISTWSRLETFLAQPFFRNDELSFYCALKSYSRLAYRNGRSYFSTSCCFGIDYTNRRLKAFYYIGIPYVLFVRYIQKYSTDSSSWKEFWFFAVDTVEKREKKPIINSFLPKCDKKIVVWRVKLLL